MDILHVDDEDDIREITRMSLELDGRFCVTSVSSGQAALKTLSASRPNAILLDVMMPEMSGPDLKIRLSADPATASIPVIFMTAAARAETVRELIQLGAIGVISKPFDPMTLAGQCVEHLSAHCASIGAERREN